MRLDYVLYGIAIIFFAITAISFVVVSEQNGKNLWTVSTVVFGLLSVSAGYLLKPKDKVASVSDVATANEVVPAAVYQATVETPIVETPKIEAAVDLPKIDAAPLEEPIVQQSDIPISVESPVIEAPSIESPTSVKEASNIIADIIGLTQVKGIGEKRAAQLKNSGILNIQDLAKSNVADLASKLDISPKIVQKWVADAKKIIK